MKDKEYSKIEEELKKVNSSGLSDSEKRYMWSRISRSINTASKPSSLLTVIIKSRFMIQGFIALLILVSAGTTVAASNDARPGDTLFPIDRAVENVRLVLASEEHETDLRLRFAEERLEELEEIVAEETEGILDDFNNNDDSDDASTTDEQLEVEADVFTNETVIEVEHNDEKTILITDATERDAIIEAVLNHFSELTYEEVDAVLNLELEDRESRPEDKEFDDDSDDNGSNDGSDDSDEADKNDVSEEGKERIEKGLETTIVYLEESLEKFGDTDGVRRERLEHLLERLNKQIGGLSGKIKLEIRGDDDLDSRIKIERDGEKFKFEGRDGDTHIKIEIEGDKLKAKIRFEEEHRDEIKIRHDDDDDENDDDFDDRGDGDEDRDDSDDDSDGDSEEDEDEDDDGDNDGRDEIRIRHDDDDDDDSNSGHGSRDDD